MFSRMLDEQSGEMIARHLEARGVRVLCNAARCDAVGDQELVATAIEGQEISCSLLGMGIGVETNLVCINNAGVSVSTGVLTNRFLETNTTGIYAIGDVAEFEDITVGRRLIAGNWMNALSQARTLARTLAGRDGSAFQTIINKEFPGIKEAKARIEPFWSNTFPKDPASIRIVVSEPASR